MTSMHPLIERAQKYKRMEVDLKPAGCLYDEAVGAWRVEETGKLWVESVGREGPRTKKNDIETGQDQKGE